jgi:hypothetical protein
MTHGYFWAALLIGAIFEAACAGTALLIHAWRGDTAHAGSLTFWFAVWTTATVALVLA